MPRAPSQHSNGMESISVTEVSFIEFPEMCIFKSVLFQFMGRECTRTICASKWELQHLIIAFGHCLIIICLTFFPVLHFWETI